MSLTPRLDKLEKNLIINGNMRYAQRRLGIQNGTPGAGSISYGDAEYSSLDRFRLAWDATVDGDYFQGRTADAPTADPTLESCLDIRGNTTGTSRAYFDQPIESIVARNVAGKKATFSFWYKMSGGTLNASSASSFIRVSYLNAKDNTSLVTTIVNVPVEGTLVRDGTWRRYSLTVDVPAGATNGLLVSLRWEYTDSVLVENRFAGMMLLEGEDIVPDTFLFASENEASELQLCQRYYEKRHNVDEGIGNASSSFEEFISHGSNVEQQSWSFNTKKRTAPSMTIYSSNNGASGNLFNVNTASNVAGNVEGVCEHGFSSILNTGGAADQIYRFLWAADAEL